MALAGCRSGLSSAPVEPPTPENPVSIEDAGYGQYYTQLPDSDLIVQCFERGAGKSRVLTCFKGSQDIPKDELREFAALNFSKLSYVDAGGGVTVACIADGMGKRSVLTCFPSMPKKPLRLSSNPCNMVP